MPEQEFLPYLQITGSEAVRMTNWAGIPNSTSDSWEGLSSEKFFFDSPIDFNNEEIYGVDSLNKNFWAVTDAQTGLTGSKTGSFDLTTSGVGTFGKLATNGSYTATAGALTVNNYANTLVAAANSDTLIANLINAVSGAP